MNHFEIIENSAELFYTEKKTAKEVAIALHKDEKKIIAAWELGLKINPETLSSKNHFENILYIDISLRLKEKLNKLLRS